MEVCMKETLRSLRQRKNVTQESLAKHLGITPQSVGKWERGEGFPDITLLPAIALYFGVTVDELLNVDRVRIDEKIKAYQDESHRLKNAGDNEKNRALWENAYAEFPNDCRVLFGLMFALNRDAVYPCPKEDAERIIMLGERILKVFCYKFGSFGVAGHKHCFCKISRNSLYMRSIVFFPIHNFLLLITRNIVFGFNDFNYSACAESVSAKLHESFGIGNRGNSACRLYFFAVFYMLCEERDILGSCAAA